MSIEMDEEDIALMNAPMGPLGSSDIEKLYAHLKVTNLKDAIQSIDGLRERVMFTKDYEALLYVCRDLVAWDEDAPHLQPLPAILATMRSLLQSATGAPEDAT